MNFIGRGEERTDMKSLIGKVVLPVFGLVIYTLALGYLMKILFSLMFLWVVR